jgi:5S rRNA maturation endonuclease (ribonuclease M5)
MTFLKKLDINLRRTGKLYMGCCPIHGGDNYSAINLYPEGDKVPGLWRCNTRHCEWVFKDTIIGFVRGVLSHKYLHWQRGDNDKRHIQPFDKVISWLCKFLDTKLEDIQIDEKQIERHKFAAQIDSFTKVVEHKKGLNRQQIRKLLEIPAQYYLSRGYSQEILDRYDVGLCVEPNKEMYGRVVVPIYNEQYQYMIACTGRSVYDLCAECKLYHNPKIACPPSTESRKYTKWHHSGNTGSILYNWWNAATHIQESGIAVLVEGPGDVWRLEEAGIHNAVAMFGVNLTEDQEILLEKSGAMKVIIIRDNDPTGEIAAKELIKQLRSYNTQIYTPQVKDVGEMKIEDIKQEILPLCQKR